MKQNFFAPADPTVVDLIDQIEYNDLETDAEKAAFAYKKGFDTAKTKNQVTPNEEYRVGEAWPDEYLHVTDADFPEVYKLPDEAQEKDVITINIEFSHL